MGVSRDPRRDASMPLDGSWPWRSELGDDPESLPAGFSSAEEAQRAHDELAALWERLSMSDRRAFLAWFAEDGPTRWPFSHDDADDLRAVLQDLQG